MLGSLISNMNGGEEMGTRADDWPEKGVIKPLLMSSMKLACGKIAEGGFQGLRVLICKFKRYRGAKNI